MPLPLGNNTLLKPSTSGTFPVLYNPLIGLSSSQLNMDLGEYRSEHLLAQIFASFWFGQAPNRSYVDTLIQLWHSVSETSLLQSAIEYTLSGDSPAMKHRCVSGFRSGCRCGYRYETRQFLKK